MPKGDRDGPPSGHKRGNLGRDEQEFITRNVDRFTVKEIADHLNRGTTPVYRYIHANKIGKKYAIGKFSKKTTEIIQKELIDKPFFENLKTQLTNKEVAYFANHWGVMVLQFNGDLLASEEMELKELLILEIMKNREATGERDRMVMREILNKDLRREQNKDVKDRDIELMRTLNAEVTAVMAASAMYIRNFKDLCDRADKMRKALHASRQDRAVDFKNSKIDFSAWLKMLEEHENKIQAGREMEIIRMAKEKEGQKLGSYHTYSNKEVARPILSADTIEQDETEEGEIYE